MRFLWLGFILLLATACSGSNEIITSTTDSPPAPTPFTIPPLIDLQGIQLASFEQVAAELATCQLNITQGRVSGIDFANQPIELGGGAQSQAVWADRRLGAESNLYIEMVYLVNIPTQDLHLVCDFANKELGHIPASDWLVNQLEALTNRPFEEVLLQDEFSSQAITGYVDYLAIANMSESAQIEIAGFVLPGYRLTQYDILLAQQLYNVGKITDPISSWWQEQPFWNELPEYP